MRLNNLMIILIQYFIVALAQQEVLQALVFNLILFGLNVEMAQQIMLSMIQLVAAQMLLEVM